jgi:glycosyltransferase involved in cell wall biosynthesis
VKQSKFQDYEHIIVDDQSSDDSVAIAKTFAEKDARIQVYVNEKNLGDYPNRNRAAELANGKYLKYLDADDKHGRWILSVMVDAMDEFPEAALGLLNSRPPYPNPSPFPTCHKPQELVNQYLDGKTFILNRSPLGAIIHREKFMEMGGFSGKRMVGDFEMWMKLGMKFNVVAIPHMLAMYRVHEEQEMSHHAADPIWGFRYLLVSHTQLSCDHNSMPGSLQKKHLFALERKMARSILTSIRHHGLRKANEMRQEAELSWGRVWKAAFP